MEVLLGAGIALFFALPLWMLYCSRHQGKGEVSQDGCLLMLLCGGWSAWALASVISAGSLHRLLLTLVLIWAWIMLANHVVPVPSQGSPGDSGPRETGSGRRQGWTHVLLMVMLALISGGLLVVLTLPGLPFELPSRLVLSLLLFPLLWSTLTLWACVDRVSWRPPILGVLALSVSAILLWFQG